MTPDVYAARRERLREKIRSKDIPALLVSHPANRFYLSGFEHKNPQCNETSGWLLVRASGRDVLMTDPRYEDAARRLWPAEDLFIYSGKRLDMVGAYLQKEGFSLLGFEPRAMSVFEHARLKEMVGLSPADGLVEELRLIKDEEEVRRMAASCALNHRLMDRVQGLLTPGKAESELAWEIEQFFRNSGAPELAFDTIVGVGPNAALPHCVPGDTPIRENEMVLVDTGCRLADYNSDQTRTFWVGEAPSPRFRQHLELVREAQAKAMEVIRPGTAFADAYKAAWSHFDAHGVARLFTHSLGHGIGLETHEGPSLNPLAAGEFRPGMVVTVEPGLYDPAWGGIRWEYMVLVTGDGCRVL